MQWHPATHSWLKMQHPSASSLTYDHNIFFIQAFLFQKAMLALPLPPVLNIQDATFTH